jgi:molecular chaperone GrpE
MMEISGLMAEDTTNQGMTENSESPNRETQNKLPELSEVDMLSGRVVELENAVTQYKDQLLRKAAEFENYKKRIENDSANLIRYANEDLIEKLLPVIDDFDRSFNALKNLKNTLGESVSTESDSIIKGIELIYNKFKRILELQDVKPLDVVGKPFDPALHDALMMMPSADQPPNTVLQEVERGYTLHDRVIRHAKVIVSAEPARPAEPMKDSLSESD